MDDPKDSIAIVGIGCHFPGGEGVDNFWKVLLEGKNCTQRIPKERFDVTPWYHSDDSKPGKSRTECAALIDGLNMFDHKFFGIAEDEALQMDPQQKLLLECSYRALEDAGIPMEKASGTKTGVYIGLMNRDFEIMGKHHNPADINHRTSTGSAMSIAANRISYTFNLMGPSLALDTACSSSLIAVDLACQAIKHGNCEMALCGGVSCILEPQVFVALSKAKMISPDGASKPFSSQADGYGRGEGCGIILLKPLENALKDCDRVWGVILATAVNHGGHSVTPITKPSQVQQENLLKEIYGGIIDPSSIQYIEAHGTGTPVGDPLEAGSISNIIAKARPLGMPLLYMGSVKGNIGHTESASGVAGLIKVLLMMHHQIIVPSIYYSKNNTSIDCKALNLKVPTKSETWKCTASSTRAAGVNSFGFGGTNAHVVVKEHKALQRPILDHGNAYIFVLSAWSEKSMRAMIEDTAQQIDMGAIKQLNQLTYTSACRRSHVRHRYRKAFVTSSLQDLGERLKSAVKTVPSKLDGTLVLVFCGNGLTYRGMCKQLLRQEPVFRDKLREIDSLLEKYLGPRILEKLYNDTDDFFDPDINQPLLFAVQVAIFCLLKHWGIKPNSMLGHSVGEVAAAHCSGRLSLEDAVKVIYIRSSLQKKVTGGKMLVVSNISVTEVEKIIEPYRGRVCLAALNSPVSCTLSGDTNAIDSLHQTLKGSFSDKDLFLRPLNVPAAYHSHWMDPILPEIEHSIGSLQEHKTETELYSTVTGKACSKDDFCSGTYWTKNIRQPVAFEQAVKSAATGKKNLIFVEIGPRPALQRNIIETLDSGAIVLPSVKPEDDHVALLTLTSKLFELGLPVNWDTFYRGQEVAPILFPKYQFDCTKNDLSYKATHASSSHHPVLIHCGSNDFLCNFFSDSTSYLQEHKNNGVPILPGSLYVELGLASYCANFKVPLRFLELSISFKSPFVLSQNSPHVKVKLESVENDGKEATFNIFSGTASYASGRIQSRPGRKADEEFISLETIANRCKSLVKSEEFYEKLNLSGFQYGSVFKSVDKLYHGKEYGEAITHITLSNEVLNHLHDYHIHPVVLDYFLQVASVINSSTDASRPGYPSSIGSITVFHPLQKELVIYLKASAFGQDHFVVCGCFTDQEGTVLVELKHITITYLNTKTSIKELFFQNKFCMSAEQTTFSHKPKVLVVCERQRDYPQHLKSLLQEVKQLVHPESTLAVVNPFQVGINFRDFSNDFNEILLLLGLYVFKNLMPHQIVDHIVTWCHLLCKLVGKLGKTGVSLRVVTYTPKSDIGPSFALSGLTRTCAAEIDDVSFQLIDIKSFSHENIRALGQVLCSYPCDKFSEVTISEGQIYTAILSRTLFGSLEPERISTQNIQHGNFLLKTNNPYKITEISALPFSKVELEVPETMVEVELNKICVHSADYYPVSVTDKNFGRTMYWNKHASTSHTLLALDFSGTVTAVGKNVKDLRIGDQIVSCYPVEASSKIIIPESVCYSADYLPFLTKTPCVSYFVLAWEVLCLVTNEFKKPGKLKIVSVCTDAGPAKALSAVVGIYGWSSQVVGQHNAVYYDCDVLVLLSPLNPSVIDEICRDSAAKHIVAIGDSQSLMPFFRNILANGNDNVCINVLNSERIFQKANIKKCKPAIQNLFNSLSRISVNLDFSNRPYTHNLDANGSDSYLNSKIISVILLRKDENAQGSHIPVLQKQKVEFHKNAVYIVSGGLSGLGFETVKFIAQRKGGYIVTLSRRRPTPEIQHEIDEIQNTHGCTVISLQCDISDTANVREATREIKMRFPLCPVKGVFHSAAVLHDCVINKLDAPHFEKVMKPKVCGVLNLHLATEQLKLDYFVCYSSITSCLGNASQANYAAANSFLDQFCHYRRSKGMAAQSINWGPLNLGLLQNKDEVHALLETKGLMLIEVSEVLEALEECLLLNKVQQIVCRFNFENLASNVLRLNTSLKARMSELAEEALKRANKADPVLQQVRSTSTPEDYIRSLINEVISAEVDDLRDDSSLYSLGIDSMLAMTMQNRIFKERGINVPFVRLLDPQTTILSLVLFLKKEQDRNH